MKTIKKTFKTVAIVLAVLFIIGFVGNIIHPQNKEQSAKQEQKYQAQIDKDKADRAEKKKAEKEKVAKQNADKDSFKTQANVLATQLKSLQNVDLNVVSDVEYNQAKQQAQNLNSTLNQLLSHEYAKTSEGRSICGNLTQSVTHTQLFVYNYNIDDYKTLSHEANLGVGYLGYAQTGIDKL